jgi:hypothetical protein
MKLEIFAPCYGPPGTEKIADRLKHSARHFGYPEVQLYGLGRLSPGSPHGGDMQGTWVIEELLKSKADIVIVCDAADVLFTAPMHHMLDAFDSFHSNFVIGPETDAHGMNQELRDGMQRLHLEANGRYGNVNIGYWIGHRKYAMNLLRDAIALYRGTPDILDNPQVWLPYGLIQDKLHFTLDRNCRIFQPGRDDTDCRIENGCLHNLSTGTWPSMIHYNGTGGGGPTYQKMYEDLIR